MTNTSGAPVMDSTSCRSMPSTPAATSSFEWDILSAVAADFEHENKPQRDLSRHLVSIAAASRVQRPSPGSSEMNQSEKQLPFADLNTAQRAAGMNNTNPAPSSCSDDSRNYHDAPTAVASQYRAVHPAFLPIGAGSSRSLWFQRISSSQIIFGQHHHYSAGPGLFHPDFAPPPTGTSDFGYRRHSAPGFSEHASDRVEYQSQRMPSTITAETTCTRARINNAPVASQNKRPRPGCNNQPVHLDGFGARQPSYTHGGISSGSNWWPGTPRGYPGHPPEKQVCRVATCQVPLAGASQYSRRRKICQTCILKPSVVIDNVEMRYCQQCRYSLLSTACLRADL